MKTTYGLRIAVVVAVLSGSLMSFGAAGARQPRTSFQTSREWRPELHLPADIAIVYGTNPGLIESWKSRGFIPFAMFSASWLGRDAEIVKNNPGIVQMMAGGQPFEMIPGRAWVSPTEPWREYMKSLADAHIEAGARAILPEEPEYFASTGYEDAFKKEWRMFYGESWRGPYTTPSSVFKANRLKASLFEEFYRDLCGHVKEKAPDVLCIVPMHSNLNYAQWGIVSPHHAISALDAVDGFVGQVWTGTARGMQKVGGKIESDVFSYALLEYNYFENLTAGTGKSLILLTDPVDDREGDSWAKLRDWHEDTLAAALMQMRAAYYEVVPWPERVFLSTDKYGAAGGSSIPQEHASALMTMWSAQRRMPGGGRYAGGTTVIGALTADTLMWQKGAGSDRLAGHLAPMLSLARAGVNMKVVPAERMAEPGYMPPGIRLLIASFDAWKPEDSDIVDGIAEWVKKGGILFLMGGEDSFNNIDSAWWKQVDYDTPTDALLEKLLPGGTPAKRVVVSGAPGADGKPASKEVKLTAAPQAPANISYLGDLAAPAPAVLYDAAAAGADVWMTVDGQPAVWAAGCGEGLLVYSGVSGEFVAEKKSGEDFLAAILEAALARGGKNSFVATDIHQVSRGPFLIVHSLRGSHKLKGSFINAMKPYQPVTDETVVEEGGNAILLDVLDASMDWCNLEASACVVFAGGNVSGARSADDSYEFLLSGPEGVFGAAWVMIASLTPPAKAFYKLPGGEETLIDLGKGWHELTGVQHLIAPLHPDGTLVRLEF